MYNSLLAPDTFSDLRVSFAAPTSLVIRLRGRIDGQIVDDVRRAIERAPREALDVTLDCAGVSGIDPVGAARLWLLCLNAPASFGRKVTLADLPLRLARRMRTHPLLAFVPSEDAMFEDPFGRLAPSDR